MRRQILASTTAVVLLLGTMPAFADMDAARAFLDAEIGDLSALDRAGQEAEMQWFIDAAQPFRGMDIKVVSETITTHEYEARVLAPAFSRITGINITHDLIGEGDVVEKLQTQMQSGENIYDAYINDSDLIGTHWRYQQVRNLTDWMANEGADVTNPDIDIDDFIGKSFTTAPDGKLYQLPDQQFANLYWFRYDWFNDEAIRAEFREKYGYDLGVPVNWSAYEDIAEFFTGREIDGKRVYGHMDYGKKDPSLGWRFTDAWLSMAGNGDKGIPNGLPVDEFNFEEETDGHEGRQYAWMNAAHAMAVNINRAHKEYGWTVQIRGVQSGGEVTGLPLHTFDTGDGSTDMQCPTEFAISDRREGELSKSGLIGLIHRKNTDKAAFIGAQSLHKPAEYDDPDATANANLAARLPYLFATCRFAHYLKCMVRDKIGSFKSRDDMQQWLQSWILQYVDMNPETSSEGQKARKPLAAAEVVVDEIEGNPGYYSSKFFLRPHYQLEGLTVSLRLVSKLPSEKQ